MTSGARHTTALAQRAVDSTAKPVVRWAFSHGLPKRALQAAAGRGDLQARMTTETRGRLPEELTPLFADLRAAGPISRSKFAHITGDHAIVKQVLTSNDFRTGFDARVQGGVGRVIDWSKRDGLHPVEPPSLLVTDPPDHTRYRKLVTKVFTARAVEGLRARTEQIAADLLDRIGAGGDVELVSTYCANLPVTVIAEILGVPEEDRGDVLRMGGHAAASLDLGLDWSTFRTTEGALDEFDGWLTGHIDRIRRSPGDDLFSQLVAASDDGEQLTERELKSTAGLVLAAGFETTVNLLGNAIRLLHDHPDQLGMARADQALWPNVVEEALRFDPPVLLTGRTALTDTELARHRVKAEELVVVVLAAANRDPKVFDRPDEFDVTRENARDHLSFSAGRHFCLGAALARMEAEVGLRALHERYDVQLLPGARRRPTRVLRGYETLPARLTPRSGS